MPLHVVVTGAGGFVGGFLARYLAARGFTVTAISRRPAPGEPLYPSLAWRQADLCAAASLSERFDILLHCAAEIPARCPDPGVIYERNLKAAHNVFEAALIGGASGVVFTSSMSVYGSIAVPTVDEDTACHDPDAYGRAKRDAETLLEKCVTRGLGAGLSLRLPGTVGKGSHHNFLSDALKNVFAGDTVRVNNPDAWFNNIVYVGDLAAFLARFVEAPKTGYTVCNLAAVEAMRIREVVSELFEAAGRPERTTIAVGGKQPFLISVERATALGYRPATVRASIQAFVHDCLVQ